MDPLVAELARDLEDSVMLPPHVSAVDAAVATVCTLTVRLTGGGARNVVASLPGGLRDLFEPCARPAEDPGEPFNRDAFLQRLGERLRIDAPDAERIALGVFNVLRARLPERAVRDVAAQLPGPLAELWLRSAPGPGPLLPRVGHFVIGHIERSGALPLGVDGAHALEAVTCAVSQAVGDHCGGPLRDMFPRSLRPLVEGCSSHRGEPRLDYDAAGFVERVAGHLDTDAESAEVVSRVVFDALQRYVVSSDTRQAIASAMTPELRRMWQEPLRPSLAEAAEEEPEPV